MGYDDVFIGYEAGYGCCGEQSIVIGDHPGPYTPIPDPAPDTWHCAYCDRANPGDRLTCVGCQAGRPGEAEDAGLEIRVFSTEGITVKASVETDAIRERWGERYKGYQGWSEAAILGSGVHYDPVIECGQQLRPAILPTDTFGAERTGSILQRIRKMVGIR